MDTQTRDGRAVERLAPHPLFAQLDRDDLISLVQATVKRVQASKGNWLYLQGEYDRALYVLDRGSARLLRVEGDGSERVVREFAESLDRVVVPEMNLGQICHVVRESLEGSAVVERVSKIGGEIITPDEICRAVVEHGVPVRTELGAGEVS